MRRGFVVAVLAVVLSVAACAASAKTSSNAKTRGLVLDVGDSNVTLGVASIDRVLTSNEHNENGYVPVIASRIGASIRTPDCLDSSRCTTHDYWKLKLATILPRIKPDAIVNNLGVNDTVSPGTVGTPGYSSYSHKIDGFMKLVGGTQVLWTNLPCKIEPKPRRTGCQAVNRALSLAHKRWPNLEVLSWDAVADEHPEFMASPGTGIHYTRVGYAVWARFVVGALDARFPAP
jgi:lysophospholipase L1-like esterase